MKQTDIDRARYWFNAYHKHVEEGVERLIGRRRTEEGYDPSRPDLWTAQNWVWFFLKDGKCTS
jgi:hypothetical protein